MGQIGEGEEGNFFYSILLKKNCWDSVSVRLWILYEFFSLTCLYHLESQIPSVLIWWGVELYDRSQTVLIDPCT